MDLQQAVRIAVLWLSAGSLVVQGRVLDAAEQLETGSKIFGGSDAVRQKYRYNAWISLNDVPHCGGTLLTEEWVLTAASCVAFEPKLRLYRVWLGDYNRASEDKEFKTRPLAVFIHPSYVPGELANNIALIQLSKPAPIKRRTIDVMPNLAPVDYDLVNNSNCYMTGWGTNAEGDSLWVPNGPDSVLSASLTVQKEANAGTFKKRLQYLPVQIQEFAVCPNPSGDPSQLCYDGSPGGPCGSDIGSPILCVINGFEVQVGINIEIGCNAGLSLMTKVSVFYEWIDNIISPSPVTTLAPPSPTPLPPVTTTDPQRSCVLPSPQPNSVINIQGNFEGDMAYLICDVTYRPSFASPGGDVIVCQANGLFTEFKATCIKVQESFGTNFVFGFIQNAFSEGTHYIYVTANDSASVIVGSPFLGEDVSVVVNKYAALQVANSFAGSVNGEKSNKGIYVSSDIPVSVFAHSYRPGNGPSADGTLIMPERSLSTRNVVVAHNRGPLTSLLGNMMVVATEDNTNVQIAIPGVAGSIDVALDRYGTYFARGNDFTGTLITADKTIAVMAGHECGSVPNEATEKCDHMFEMIPPTSALSRRYIATTFKPRPKYALRIVGVFDSTAVSITNKDGAPVDNVNLDLGESHYVFSLNQSVLIQASNDILVAQYGHGSAADSLNYGDPSMVILPGLSQFLNTYIVHTPSPASQYNRNWVSIIMYSGYSFNISDSGILIDGSSQPSLLGDPEFISIPNFPAYYVFHMELTAATTVIQHSDPFASIGIIQYGFNNLVEYAWAGGRTYGFDSSVAK